MTREYDAAAHIFNWARNDARLCKRMRDAIKPGGFPDDVAQASFAFALASETVRQGKNDIPRQLLEPSDYLRAAIMFLEWDGES